MAKTTATETAAPEATATTAPAVFEIADESALTRGRQAAPGIYDAAVKDAVEGKAYGINVADTAEATKVLNELRKASKHTGRKLRTWNKSEETPGYVAWKVVPPKSVGDSFGASADAKPPVAETAPAA